MGKLEEGRRVWKDGLDEGLGDVVGGEEGRDVGEGEGDGDEGFIEGEGDRSDFIFF